MKKLKETEIDQEELGECSQKKAAGGHVKRRKKTAGDRVHGTLIHLCYDELLVSTNIIPCEQADVFVVFRTAQSNIEMLNPSACSSSFSLLQHTPYGVTIFPSFFVSVHVCAG